MSARLREMPVGTRVRDPRVSGERIGPFSFDKRDSFHLRGAAARLLYSVDDSVVMTSVLAGTDALKAERTRARFSWRLQERKRCVTFQLIDVIIDREISLDFPSRIFNPNR